MNPVLPWDEQCTWDTWFRRYRSKESLRCLLSLSLSGEEPWGALGERCTWNTSACNRVTLERHSYFSTFLSPRISISTHPPPRHPPRRVCLITTDVKLALTFRSLEILTHVLVNYSSLLSIVFPFLLFSFVNGSVAICWKRNLRICLKRSLFDRSATRFISNKLVPCLYVEGNKRCVPWEIIIELRFYRENLKISSFSKINIWRMKTHLLLAMDDDERAKRQITAGLGHVEMVKSVKKQQQRTCCCCCCCLSHRVARIPEPIRSKSASDTILKIKFVLAVRNFHHGWCNAS